MKKLLLLTVLFSVGLMAGAQNYESIRNTALLQQYQKAKEDLDKAWSNAKFTSKPEAYILKAFIYASMAMDPKVKGSDQFGKLLTDADAAYRKYKEMDPSLTLVTDQIYQNGPINLYSGYFTAGYDDYSAKKWESGFENLKKAVEYSDMLIEKKLLTAALDTNVLILAGITAENGGHKDDAAKIYCRLADKKITGDGFESVYRFLVSHYFMKKDMPLFEKYKTIGAELYPKSEYFTFDKIDFAVGLVDNFEAKLKAVEEVLATDPDNFKGNEVLGEIIYDTLNPKEDNLPLPANAAELEKKMDAAFRKAAAAKADYENPWLYLGDHYINKAVKVDGERTAFAAEMKTRTKPGQPNPKEDIAKRDALDKKYADALELAHAPYEKATEIFKAKANLDQKQKQQYKKAASYLADIFAFKKVMATRIKSPDAAKYAAEEKKWNELWESIK
ncbi:MAG: hypothetical protein HZB42_06940 [Sphingobacteriales bacterium]|nr:hypothetical protein [Sphingobacteriales bacterium]